MANSDKNILIVPNTNQSGLPNIQFVGSSSAPISLSVLDDNTVSFSGSQGQLFSINNNLTSGTIFSVNDVSGIPSIEVNASGTISLARFGGNIGIGKASPNAKLDITGSTVISGNLTVIGTISGTSYQGVSGGGSGTPGGTNTTIQFNSGSTFSGSTSLVWDYTNARMGIGTSSPASTLHVRGVGSSTSTWRGRVVAGGDNVAFLMGEYNSKAWLGAHVAALNAWEDFYINPDGTKSVFIGDYPSDSITTPILSVINSTGYVGIGTTTPNAKLDINGNALITGTLNVTSTTAISGNMWIVGTTPIYIVRSTSNTSYASSRWYNDQNSATRALELGYAGSSYPSAIISNGASGETGYLTTTGLYKLQFGTNNTFGMVIDTAQNVGIGTASPGTNLEVNKSQNSSTRIDIKNQNVGSSATAFLRVENNAANALDAGIRSSNYTDVSGVTSAGEAFIMGNATGISISGLGDSSDIRFLRRTTAGVVSEISRITTGSFIVNKLLAVSGNLTVTGSIFVSGSSIYGQVAELTSSTSNYTLVRQDSGKFLNINSGSAVTVTVPTGLPTGFTISLCQLGAGQVTVSGAVGVTINNRQLHNKTAGQYAVASIVGVSADTYIFVGDTSV